MVLKTTVPNGEVPDRLPLQALKGSLDEVIQKDLQRRLEESPNLSYALYMSELLKMFDGDVNYRN